MTDKYIITSGLSYKFVLKKEDGKDYAKLKEFLDSKISESDVPNIIFTDFIPTCDELKDIIYNEKNYKNKFTSYILALKDCSPKITPDYRNVLQLGFTDIIEWEDDDEMIDYINSRLERNRLISEILESSIVTDDLVGNSIIWKKFLGEIIEAALFSQSSILLIGESGTGKEMISRLIHTVDTRADKRKFVIVDCTTIVPELSGSELFGHERGSYTNAIQSREGAVALANGGTLFLDEIGELPLNLQAELLRVIQCGNYKKVGSNVWQKTNFRLVCATNRDLRKAIAEGRFRQDLYFRIADCEYLVPNLSVRKDDTPYLVTNFLEKLFSKDKCPEVDKPVMEYLVQRDYPGNVRELKQLVQRIALKHLRHKKITIGEIPEGDRNIYYNHNDNNKHNNDLESIIRKALLTGEDWWNLKNKISETAIQVALELDGSNKQKAAERLGVDVRTVQQYVKKKGR